MRTRSAFFRLKRAGRSGIPSVTCTLVGPPLVRVAEHVILPLPRRLCYSPMLVSIQLVLVVMRPSG